MDMSVTTKTRYMKPTGLVVRLRSCESARLHRRRHPRCFLSSFLATPCGRRSSNPSNDAVMTRHFATLSASLLALLVSGCLTTTGGQADAVQKTSAVRACRSPERTAVATRHAGARRQNCPRAPTPRLPSAVTKTATGVADNVPVAARRCRRTSRVLS